jgi:hypothetical protein
MAYGITHFFANGTQAQYDTMIAAIHPAKDKLPKGQMIHLAWPTQGGFLIVAVHDSKASWEEFRDKVLHPKMNAGIKGGFPAPPVEKVFDVYKQQLS